jgi:hypothetical protein
MAITTDSLLAGVKRRGILATNGTRLQDPDLIALIDGTIKTIVVPFLDSCNGNYFVRTDTVPIVANQSTYDIPYRSVGRTLRDLKITNTDNDYKRDCPQITYEDAYSQEYNGYRYSHYFEGDQFTLVPNVSGTVATSDSLLVSYKIMPSNLVRLSQAAKVVSVSDPNVTVESVGDVATNSVVDFIGGRAGNRIYSFDATVTNVSGTTITFGADVIPSDLTAGDYISLAQTSPVVNMVADECGPWIELLATRKALQALGDSEGANEITPDIQQEQENLNKIMEPRNEGEPKVIIDRRGLVRGRTFYRSRFYYGGTV